MLTDSAQLSSAKLNKPSSAQCNATHDKIVAGLSAGVALVLGKNLKNQKPKTPLCGGVCRTPHVFPHVILRGRVSVSTSGRGRCQRCGVRARAHAHLSRNGHRRKQDNGRYALRLANAERRRRRKEKGCEEKPPVLPTTCHESATARPRKHELAPATDARQALARALRVRR